MQMAHINETQRYTIYRMRKDRKTQQDIARAIGVPHIPDRVSIRQRPPEVEAREEFGHFEMDLIQNGKDFIRCVLRVFLIFLINYIKNKKKLKSVNLRYVLVNFIITTVF